MVRNSKRKAFTIVELVIVIAVIAILAAVMIPTFSGIIENADVSADRQKLDAVNKQIRIYIDTVNQKDITTGEELRAALSGEGTATGVNFFEQFNPQSAKYGYHYWFDEAKQEVVLSKMESLTQAAVPGKMIVRADSPATENAGRIAPHDPRSFTSGFYFLDQSGNEIADLFAAIDNLSAEANLDAYTEKRDAVEALVAKRGDNHQLAVDLIERLNATTILSGNDPIVAASGTKYLHIPANKTNNNDYTLQGVGSAVDLHAAFNPNITLPENIKTGDALNAVNAALKGRNQEFHVSVEGNFDTTDTTAFAAKIKDIFGAGSVNGTITVNGNITGNISDGINIEFTGRIEISVELDYKNPVTQKVEISANGNVVGNDEAKYIALNKIKDGDINVDLTKSVLMGASGATFFQDVEWEVVKGDGVTFNEDYTKLVIPTTFTGTEITLKAKPVAVNEVRVNGEVTETKEAVKERLSGTVTLTVVQVSDVTFNLETTVDDYTNISVNSTLPLSVKYSNAATFANFGNINLSYTTVDGEAVPFNADEIAVLGAPTVTITTDAENAYFQMGESNSIDFTETAIKTITSTVTEAVTVNVSNVGEYPVNISIEPCPFELGHTKYTGHTYAVGDDNAITLGKLFALSSFFEGLNVDGTVIVKTYAAVKDADGNPMSRTETTHTLVKENKASWTDYEITLAQGTNLVEIGTNENTFYVWVDVVDGKNVTTVEEFIGGTKKTNDNVTRVLHANLSGFATKSGNLLALNGKSIYGNYFTIDASNLTDANSGGRAFISMTGGSLKQVIIDGPVYARGLMRAMDDKDKQSGFFYFGISVAGTAEQPVEIRDSYLSGFNSPIFISCHTLNVYDTTFEGGAWSNVYIRSGVDTVNFNGVKTIQNRVTGYVTEHTKDAWTNTSSAGLGIFIHNSQASGLKLNLNDTKQYNWFCSDDAKKPYATASKGASDIGNFVIDSKDGTKIYENMNLITLALNLKKLELTSLRFKDASYLKETINAVFGGSNTSFYHNVDGVNYINAGIVCIDYMEIPSLEINIDSDIAYHSGSDDVGITVGDTVLGLGMKAWTYDHTSGCCSAEDVVYRNGETFDTFEECIADFLNTRKG